MITPGTCPEHFRLNEPARRLLQDRPVRWGHAGLSEVTFYRTYSRRRPDGTHEDWGDCVVRVVEGMFTILKTHARQNHISWDEGRGQRLAGEAAQRMHEFKWTPPGRGLWMMGTDYVWERGAMALQNCAFISTERMGESVEETLFPFSFLMDTAMLGVGPGFDTDGAGKVGVRGCDGAPVVHRVADTREGWIEAMVLAMRNEMYGGGAVTLDVQDVRPAGLPLKGFGGTSSGPLPLVQGVRGIVDRLRMRRGDVIDSVLITDIMNLIGKIVVSGNVRRTAEIGFASPDDKAFSTMKNWNDHPVETGNAPPDELREESPADYAAYLEHQWTTHDGVTSEIKARYADRDWAYKFGGWRWASNNSMREKVGGNYEQYNASIAEAGEPGFVWMDLMRSHGRLRDIPNNRDFRAKGTNPCGEQPLESGEVCNLVENYPGHCDGYWDFQRTLKFSYLYAKTVTLMGTHVQRTNDIIIRNRRIGCSMSGVADAIRTIGRTEFFTRWCDQGYAYINHLDTKYSEWLGVRESIKKTSEKPSGTVSLVAGIFGPGCHQPKATGYRTMRIAVDSPVVAVLREAGYRVEPAVTDPTGTVVAYFPWVVPDGVKTDEDAGLWEQVKMAADMQYWWADNAVSYTATFTQAEADNGEIARVMQAFDGQLKGISFLKKSTGGYAQMPFTRADREEVRIYEASLLPLDWSVLTERHETEDRFCDGDKCSVVG